MPKVSIIIPVYNSEKYLRQCLDSVVNQTLKDIEIICVNDCSPDNSISILQEYANKDNRIKIIDLKENVGPGTARNNALDVAQGEYIMLLDPDDWFELDACECAYTQISENNNNLVVFNYREYIESNNEFKEVKYRIESFLRFVEQRCFKFSDLDKNWLKNAFCVVQIYNRDFLNRNNIRYANLRLGEDCLFFTKAVVYANNVSVIAKPLYNYRIRDNNENQSSKSDLWRELLYAKKISFDFAKEHCSLTELLPHLIFYIQSQMFWFNKFNKLSYFERKSFYNSIKQVFTELENEYNVSNIEGTGINLRKYMRFINDSYELYFIKSIPKQIFSISNVYLDDNTKQKCITILGIKIKLMRMKNG